MNLSAFSAEGRALVNCEYILGFSYAVVTNTGEVYPFLSDHKRASHQNRTVANCQ